MTIHGLQIGVTNYLQTGMILQVGGVSLGAGAPFPIQSMYGILPTFAIKNLPLKNPNEGEYTIHIHAWILCCLSPAIFGASLKSHPPLNPHLSQVTTDEFDAAFKIPEIRPFWGSCGKKRISIWVNYFDINVFQVTLI